MVLTVPSLRLPFALSMTLLLPWIGLQSAEAQELSTDGVVTRIVVDEGQFRGGELEGLARAFRTEISMDRKSSTSARSMRDVEVALYAFHSRNGRVAGEYRSRPFTVTPTVPGTDGGPSDRFMNVDYGDFFIQLQKVSPYPGGIRFETLPSVPAQTVGRDAGAAFRGQRLPPLLIVLMPTEPRLRNAAMVEPLALWEAPR